MQPHQRFTKFFAAILLPTLLAFGGCTSNPAADLATAPSSPARLQPGQPDPALTPPPPPPEGAFIAQITPEQNQTLLDLGIDVVIPTQVPPGFQAISVVTGTQAEGPSYMLIYQDQLNRCFAIENTAGGIGGLPEIENQVVLNPPVFDQSYILYHGAYTDPELQASFPQPNLISDWMAGDGGFYRLIGAAYLLEYYPDLICEDISPEEAIQVINSLAYLETEVVGDGIGSDAP